MTEKHAKNVRLVTLRGDRHSLEAIEQQPNGVLAWLAEGGGVVAYIPCDADMARHVPALDNRRTLSRQTPQALP